MTAERLIPEAALEKHIAFLGTTGSGKTSSAKSAIVEPALEAGQRSVIIDPTGAWWGLRVARDGRGNGFPILIFGGDHADLPLQSGNGGVLAEALATSTDSAIMDMSLMTVAERTRFFIDFAETIRRKNRGPLNIVIDEAHLFMPQSGAKSGGSVPDMLHAGNNLVSLGRSRGLRITLISQRPAKLHKDSLTQVQSLVAMRLLAPQDRGAISEWISDQADPGKGKAIVASLPGLKPGEAWVWSPLDDYLERVRFPRPRTFDSSAAPAYGDRSGPRLAPIDVEGLRSKLAAVIVEIDANDPKTLRAEIARLERAVAARGPSSPDPEILRKERDAGYADGWSRGRQRLVDEMTRQVAAETAHAPAPAAPQKTSRRGIPETTAPSSGRIGEFERGTNAPTSFDREVAAFATTTGLPPGENAILTALAMHRNGCTRAQLTVLTGYKRSSRDTYVARLRSRSLVSIDGDRVSATAMGHATLGSGFKPLPTGFALQEFWMARLPEGERRILSVLVEQYPSALRREAIDCGFKKSSRDTYLSRLATRELVTTPKPGMVRASHALFGDMTS